MSNDHAGAVERPTDIEWLEADRRVLRQRVSDLLEANNRYLERARKAEATLSASEARLRVAVEALERIKDANPRNTNSETPEQMASWTQAVSAQALATIEGEGLAHLTAAERAWGEDEAARSILTDGEGP